MKSFDASRFKGIELVPVSRVEAALRELFGRVGRCCSLSEPCLRQEGFFLSFALLRIAKTRRSLCINGRLICFE